MLETNNAFRIVTQTYFNSEHTIDFCVVKVFMVLLETKKKFLKRTKRPFLRATWLFFSGDMTEVSGNMTQVSGDFILNLCSYHILQWLS